VLYELVREHLESFVAHARENYEGGLPRYVEQEFRAFLKCGLFSEGFSRVHCDACGHDLLVAFSCHGRTICPSCTGRRMANVAAHLVDRVLPDVPLRQYVLTVPYELRKLAAFKADVLTALARTFVEAIFATYRKRAWCAGLPDAECGAVTLVQRFGSLSLHVHFHVLVLDGVFMRDEHERLLFHAAPAPTAAEVSAIVARMQRRSAAWLRRHGYIDDRPLEDRSNEPPVQTALDACATIAMGRGQVSTMPRGSEQDEPHGDTEQHPDKPALVVEHDGFNLHAGVRIDAGDDLGRERLARYAARPPLSLERLRRLPGGRIGYRLKYVSRGRGKHRVMGWLDFMARLAAIVCPPRYPLTRFAGVLAPRSKWRSSVVPKPREPHPVCEKPRGTSSAAGKDASGAAVAAPAREVQAPSAPRHEQRAALKEPPKDPTPKDTKQREARNGTTTVAMEPAPSPHPPDVIALAPNMLAVRHWDRLLGGALYAATPRVDWALLMRRTFSVDVLKCPRCGGRLRVISVITEPEALRRILTHLGLPTGAPAVARARDPTEDVVDVDTDEATQLGLGIT
jgi:hypothetical protein